MSIDRFDDECPGCRPALMDIKTREVLPEDHPSMVIALRIWAGMGRAKREAFHRATCLNSTAPEDVAVLLTFGQEVEAALAAVPVQ